ncbi:hypothetical protein [uncultured Paludibaculum sp.]|uniref:hypothetical protein n=1 Tax=uncultured Paludibaculum sp. TaxID=1765020 RepID=UPI002AAC0D7F|nr:hypothetical protein [uncultured Paludibaculum sp.]
MKDFKLRAAGLTCLALGVCAQAQTVSSYRASVSGSNTESGKCTIEVVVDSVVEIQVRGEQGRMRTLSGQPGQWRRFQCDGRLPLNMSEFRFKGVDGRGRVELVQDPRNNNGVAMVRIEDSKGGSEGYTFDLEWRGGSGTAGGSWGGGSSWGSGNGSGNGSGWGSGNGSGSGSGWGSTRPGFGGNRTGNRSRMSESIRACQDTLRNDAQQRGYTDVRFRTTNTDNNNARMDRVTGTLQARGRNNRTDSFNYSCDADFSAGTATNAVVNRQ